MAGRSARGRRVSQESSQQSMRAPERHRRSLSQGGDDLLSDDTPRPPGVLQGSSVAPTTGSHFSNNPVGNASAIQGSAALAGHDTLAPPIFHAGVEPPGHSSSKRLGFLGEKLLSSASSVSSATTLRSTPTAQLLPRSHSRAESTNLLGLPREATASPASGMSTSSSPMAKAHTSPSKIVGREMHRLGNLTHLPVLNPSISASSTLALANATPSTHVSTNTATDTPWPTLHIWILPLFNGEPLRKPIEDLNSLVKKHIQTVISSTPSKALAMLEKDATELIAHGMVTLNAKLSGIEDERKLVHRVVEVWGFFWDQVLPYVEGALLPLQTDPMISSLSRMPKTIKPSSPTADTSNGKISSSTKPQQIDVRTIALQLFRDQIIYPIFPILHDCLTEMKDHFLGGDLGYQQPRLQQMLLVLVSQRSPPSTVTDTLGSSPPPLSPGEEAIQALLRVIRTPLVHNSPNRRNRRYHFGGTGAPSFLSAGLPRDRRGRIAKKPDLDQQSIFESLREEDLEGGETPRMGVEMSRERGWEVLESLRSPDHEGTTRASMGGWGLGAGAEEKKSEDDDDDENLDWDQAQAVVERMVGLKSSDPPPPPPAQPVVESAMSRRKLT